jgi:hypothetical protein
MVMRLSQGWHPGDPRARQRPSIFPPFRATVAALVLAILVALVWWWTHPPDPAGELLAQHRPLVALERVPAPELGRGFERWRMIAAGRDTVTGLWRAAARRSGSRGVPVGATAATSARGVAPMGTGAPEPPSAPEWVAVLLGGIGTDDRAALLVPDSLPVGVLAVSWPWKGPRRMGQLEFFASVPAFRSALLRTPGAVARGVAAVRRACPGSRVALIGASLGVPPTVAALPLARPEALALLDGAADLSRLLRSETSRALGGGPAGAALAPAAAALGARLLSSLEPARYGSSARGTPVLLVDAAREERYPRACVARLHATFPHAACATHPGGHMRPGNQREVASVVEAVWSWLDTLAVATGAPAR